MKFPSDRQGWLNRIKFLLRFNPEVVKGIDPSRYMPDSVKAVILISADFEMAWASRYSVRNNNSLQSAVTSAVRERHNIPKILDLCDTYGIPITWATVGHLFLECCRPSHGRKHPEIPRINAYDGPFWSFADEDWFGSDPCSDYRTEPGWYAPDLIGSIIRSKTQHEIGCHTFSHIDCREEVCPRDLMSAELAACAHTADRFGIQLKSFVHPGHLIGHLDILAEQGFTSFRTDRRNVLGYPKRHETGLWEFEQTAELAYRSDWSIRYHIRRYCEIIRRAVQSNTVCVLWFHPSFDTVVAEKIMPELFSFLYENQKQLWITTHGNYIEWLNSHVGNDR